MNTRVLSSSTALGLFISLVCFLIPRSAVAAELDLRFVSTAKTKATVGETYQYTARAESKLTSSITYSLTEAPQGMTCDSTTGLIRWHATQKGAFNVAVKALGDFGILGTAEAVQRFTLTVVSDSDPDDPTKPCVIIRGDVLLRSSAEKVTNGTVSAWNVAKASSLIDIGIRTVYTAEIKNGQYTLLVPEGTYVMRVQAKASAQAEATFETTWHAVDSVSSLAFNTAKRITVQCDDTLNVDINVNPINKPKPIIITGVVVDAATNAALRAKVTFIGKGQRILKVASDTISVLSARYTAETDVNGKYQIELPAGVYTAFASAQAGANAGIEYALQFYNEQHDALFASLIATAELKGDINFRLKKKEKPQMPGKISGKLTTEINASVKAVVSAYRITTGMLGNLSATASVVTNAEGEFEISDLPEGEYIVCVNPDENGFVGGYLSTGAMLVTSWQQAARISVKSATTATVNAVVKTAAEVNGFARIAGRVVASTSAGAETAIGGAVVTCVDAAGKIIACTFTNASGAFEVDFLAAGEVNVVIDKIGFLATSNETEVSADKPAEEQTYRLSGVTSVDQFDISSAVSVYPNPAVDVVTVDANGTSITRVELFSLNGELIATSDSQRAPLLGDSYSIPLNVPQGVYVVRIFSGNSSVSKQLTVVR